MEEEDPNPNTRAQQRQKEFVDRLKNNLNFKKKNAFMKNQSFKTRTFEHTIDEMDQQLA